MFTLATVRDHRRHRRNCRAALQQVPLPGRFSLEDFCQQVAEHRGRPLRLLTAPVPTQPDSRPCGAWFARDEEDLVFVEPGVSPLHREHIVLHELGHMLCGHQPAESMPAHLAAALFPSVSPELVSRMLGRTVYDEPHEAEAEVFATMVGARIGKRTETPAPSLLFSPAAPTPATSEVLASLSRTLEVDENHQP